MSAAVSSLESSIREWLVRRPPVVMMAHLVLGYPSLAENARVIEAMVASGVELIEIQVPFSEPIADGPVIALANQEALNRGFRVREGLQFLATMVRRHPVAFLLMTYFNILHAYGVAAMVEEVALMGVRGVIIPDLPPEEATEAVAHCRRVGIDWIQLMTPTSDDERLRQIGREARGMCYCVARKGVTGLATDFDQELASFLGRCRLATGVPLAVGFGVRTPADVRALVGRAEIAVVGSAAIEAHRLGGAEEVGRLFRQLRPLPGD